MHSEIDYKIIYDRIMSEKATADDFNMLWYLFLDSRKDDILKQLRCDYHDDNIPKEFKKKSRVLKKEIVYPNYVELYYKIMNEKASADDFKVFGSRFITLKSVMDADYILKVTRDEFHKEYR